MAKHKYTVVTPHGTFTRTTHRTYTHIVVIKQKNLQYIAGRRDKSVAYHKAELQRYIDSGEERYAEYERKAIEHAAELAREQMQKSQFGMDAQVAGWAGRLDLAQKVAKSVEKNFGVHDIVEIYPVPQEVSA